MRASGLENEVDRDWDGWVTSYESVHFLRVAIGLQFAEDNFLFIVSLI